VRYIVRLLENLYKENKVAKNGILVAKCRHFLNMTIFNLLRLLQKIFYKVGAVLGYIIDMVFDN